MAVPSAEPEDASIKALEELFEETKALGDLLRGISEHNSAGIPSAAAANAFAGWLAAATPVSKRPEAFADVAENYVAGENTNEDLWNIFSLLESYIEFPIPEPEPHVFIGLPLFQPDA